MPGEPAASLTKSWCVDVLCTKHLLTTIQLCSACSCWSLCRNIVLCRTTLAQVSHTAVLSLQMQLLLLLLLLLTTS
jgi:hypothetical protein